MAKSVIHLVNQAKNSRGITLNNQISDNLPKIIGDERRIKQIFINLLSNAVKFTDYDGTVGLNATLRGDDGMQIKITDSGIGMDEKEIEIALTKFGQIDSEITREQEGTGSGLPLTKGLVEAHGGTLTIDSKLGIGITVNVYLPKERVI